MRRMEKLIQFLDKDKERGSRKRLAEAINRRPSYLSRQLSGDRRFTAKDAMKIEKYTKGEVRCEDLLPDLDWPERPIAPDTESEIKTATA
jgi:DNA-binding transcriptional regulator YdaS (Cro superfamily)